MKQIYGKKQPKSVTDITPWKKSGQQRELSVDITDNNHQYVVPVASPMLLIG
jgi:hypothetical protein